MSRYDAPAEAGKAAGKRAVALKYGVNDDAPAVVASGMGYLAEKILDVAQESGVPIYEDNSLATILSQLNLGQEVPEELYRAVVEIYVYFLNFDPHRSDSSLGPEETGPSPPAPGVEVKRKRNEEEETI